MDRSLPETRPSATAARPRVWALPAFSVLALAACANMNMNPFGGKSETAAAPATTTSSTSSATAAAAPARAATPAPAPAPDNSPSVRAAVRVSTLKSEGLAGFFPFEGQSTTLTRADMQRDETSTRMTSTVSRFLVSDTATARITRLDKRLVYGLDIPKAEYTECPLTGCVVPGAAQPPREREKAQPSPTRERDCTMRVASNTFNVKPTSQRKPINGFDTEQYNVDWSVAFEDTNKRRSTLQLTIDLWTTPVTPAIKEAMAIEASFAKGAMAKAERPTVLPGELVTTMNRYFANSLTAADRAALFNVGKQMERIKGQPIVTQLKVFLRGDACGGAASEEGDGPRGGGGMAGALAGLLGGGGGGAGGGGGEQPLLSFTQEVKTWKVDAVRESQFAPPPQFRRINLDAR